MVSVEQPGQTPVRLRLGDGTTADLTVTYRDPTIQETLRTFEIKCRWTDPPPEVAPGMMAHATVVLDQRLGRGVPAESVVRRGDDRVVFVIDDGHARHIPVTTGYQTGGWIEIIDGISDDITHVIRSGQHLLEDGDPVRVTDREADDVSV